MKTQSAQIHVDRLYKSFRRANGDVVLAVDGVSLEVSQGEFVVLLGPSGCGKTTLLRCIAGLERPDEGLVEIQEQAVFSSATRTNVPPEKRNTSMLFQSYALWPHMTVFENVAYPLKSRRLSKAAIKSRVEQALASVECSHLAQQHPGQISGGQQQRVALARALVNDHKTMLFDEPLSNVDAQVREKLRTELLTLQRRIGFAAVYVTHDQSEALMLADRIAVLADGRIEQIATPREIYQQPASRYVARFFGHLNEASGTVLATGAGRVAVKTILGYVECPASLELEPDSAVTVAVRPENCTMGRAPGTSNSWRGTIQIVRFLGPHTEYFVDVSGIQFRLMRFEAEPSYVEGQEVWISANPQDILVFPDEPGQSELDPAEDRPADES